MNLWIICLRVVYYAPYFFCDFSFARELADQGDSAKYFYAIHEHLKDPKSAFHELDLHVLKITADFFLHPGGFRQEIS